MELRCDSSILHGILSEDFVEVTCRSRWCGKEAGVVVLHRFNKTTGELIATKRFKEKEVSTNGTRYEGIAVRSA